MLNPQLLRERERWGEREAREAREARMSECELSILLDSDRAWGARRYGLHCISLRSNYYSLVGFVYVAPSWQ